MKSYTHRTMQGNNQNHVASNLPIQLALSLLSACSVPEGGEVLKTEDAGCTGNRVRVIQIFTLVIRASNKGVIYSTVVTGITFTMRHGYAREIVPWVIP